MCLSIKNNNWKMEIITVLFEIELGGKLSQTNTLRHKDLDRFLVDDYIANQVKLWINRIMS
jgi:hypothetical protein